MKPVAHLIVATSILFALVVRTDADAADPIAPTNWVTTASITQIAERIRAQSTFFKPAEMRAYTNHVLGTKASYVMLAIPGGEFVMGSVRGGRFAKPDEHPPHRVKLEPFWMGQCEVTWNEFDAFVYDDLEGRQARQNSPGGTPAGKQVDAVTHPTLPYVDMAFGMNKSGHPAIAMTQHAASQYCQWLSAKTGHFYRLPTEAEWEYAARAGTTNIWFFGADESKLPDYAWFENNPYDRYQKVGCKLPNAWGLHDMLGNVSEWVFDKFDGNFYEVCARKGTVAMPWNTEAKPYHHSVRGGSWRDTAEFVRCAARERSNPKWKAGDPQKPPNMFWLMSCDFVGFRTVRPLTVPPVEEMCRYWNSDVAPD